MERHHSRFKLTHQFFLSRDVAHVGMPAIRNMTLLDMSHDAVRAAVFSSLVAMETNNGEGLKEAYDNMDAEIRNATYAALPGFMTSFRSLESSLDKLGTQIEADAAAENIAGREILHATGIITVAAIVISLALSFIILMRLLTTFRATLQRLRNAVQELFQSVRTTSDSLEESTSTLRHFKSRMDEAQQITFEVKNVGESCHTLASEATGQINRMIDTIEKASQESHRMQNMTRAIEDIAFQTHLLAVNASIEAARAGHQGRGFAVVADAVQNLAAKSSQSAKVIGEQIHETIQDMQQGNRVADEGRKSMQRIHSATAKQVTLNGQQFSIHQEQHAGINEINRAMTLLDEEAQRNARVAESLTESAAQLTKSTDELSELMELLRLELGTKTS